MCLSKNLCCECLCSSVYVHMYVRVYLCLYDQAASCLWVEFAVGPSLDSVSQPGLAPGMEFPLRIKQDSTGKPGRPRGGGGEGDDAPTLISLEWPQFWTVSEHASAIFALSFRPCRGHGPEGWASREELPPWASVGKLGVAAAKTGAMRRPPENGEAASGGIGGGGLWGRQEPRRLGCAVRIWESGCVGGYARMCSQVRLHTLWGAGGG